MDVLKLSWMEAYQLAKAYRIHNGNLDVPSTFWTINGYEEVKVKKEGLFNLGRWLSKERYGSIENENYNITDKHKELLNEIDMIWDIHEYRWNKKYNLAKAYYEHHGNLDVPSTFWTKNGYEETTENKDDKNIINLGQWISDQRTTYHSYWLPKEKENKLNEIAMIWDTTEYKWNKMYELAKIYNKYYSHLNISNSFKTKNGYEEAVDGLKLGYWIDTQRRKYRGKIEGILTDEQLKLLEELDIIWFGKKDEEYQKEPITSTNNYLKQIEIYNRFRSCLNKISNDTNITSKEEINQRLIDQLNGKYEIKNIQKVTSLEKAIDETIKAYEYEKNSDRIEILVYYLILHIDRMDQYGDAYLAFTEKNGARAYIKSKGKTALIEEMYCSLALNNENIDNTVDIFQEYANSYYNKRYKEVNQELSNQKKEKRMEK